MHIPSFLLSALLLIGITACQPESKEVVQHYGTGQISRRHTEVNGKKEGTMTEYYPDGTVKGVRLFEHDIQVGKTIYYYPGGAVKEVQYYDQGKINGGDTVFYENGKPQFLRTFDHGKLHGDLRKWAEDGSIIFEARYDQDKLAEVKGQEVRPDSMPHLPDTLIHE